MNEAASDDSDSDESGECRKSNGDPSYSSRVEFALKLGYTELQVQKALSKLGPNPAQNELLAELIRLASLVVASSAGGGANTTSTVVGGGAKADAAELMEHRSLSASVSDDTALRHIVIDGSNVAIRCLFRINPDKSNYNFNSKFQ